MTQAEMNQRISDRTKEIVQIPEIQKHLLSFEDREEAQNWLFMQALITLMYSHEERMEMVNRKSN